MLVLQASPESARASPRNPPAEIAVAGMIVAACFSEDWARRFEVAFPTAMVFEDPTTEPTVLSLTWDDRLFEVDLEPFVLVGDRLESVAVDRRAAGELRVTLPVDVMAVYQNAKSRPLYPNENLTVPVSSRVVVESDGGTRSVDGSSSVTSAEPWGLELRAEWQESEGYTYPSLVHVTSTGPFPAPAGVEVVARVYRDVAPLNVSDVDLEAGFDERLEPLATERKSKAADYRFVLAESVPSGESVQLLLQPDSGTESSTRAPSFSQIGQIYVSYSEQAAMHVRATGRYSIAPVTSSGSPLTDFSAAARA